MSNVTKGSPAVAGHVNPGPAPMLAAGYVPSAAAQLEKTKIASGATKDIESPSVAQYKIPFHAVPVVEAALVPAVPASLLAEPTEATMRIHDELRATIRTLATIDACCGVYDSAMFQECTRLVRKSQADFVKQWPDNSALEMKEEWARSWAQSQEEDWARALNLCRKTALMLLYKVCDLCLSTSPPRPELAETVFQRKRINAILYPCVVMDRANCLYAMRNSQTNKLGLGWYSKGDEADYQALRDPPLALNPEGHTINRRLRWLQANLYSDDETLKRWLTIQAPPSSRTT